MARAKVKIEDKQHPSGGWLYRARVSIKGQPEQISGLKTTRREAEIRGEVLARLLEERAK